MLSLKGKFKIGFVCLIVLCAIILVVEPKNSTPPTDPATVSDTAPVATYTFEQQQNALKAWMKDFELKTTTVNEQWEKVPVIVANNEQEGIYGKLDDVKKNLENLEGTYSTMQPPAELTLEQQKVLKQIAQNMDESISSRIKYIRHTEAYELNQRNINYRRGQEQKELIELYQTSSSVEIKKLAEFYKIQ